MSKYVFGMTTVSNEKEAEKMAHYLVKKKLVACVNVFPSIVSFYHWKGKFRKGSEYLLLFKTLASKAKVVEKAVNSIHPYELPEFLLIPIQKGSKRYLKWLTESVS